MANSPPDIFIATLFSHHSWPCNVHQANEDTSQPFDVIMKGRESATRRRLTHEQDKLRLLREPLASDHPINAEGRLYMIARENASMGRP